MNRIARERRDAFRIICLGQESTKQKRGFTLVEVLVSLLIGGIAVSTALFALYTFFSTVEHNTEYAEAQQNAEMALSFLEPYVLLAGLGMPNNDDPGKENRFSTCWPSGSGSSPGLPLWRRSPHFWTSAVSCVGEGNSELRLVSAVPRKCAALEERILDAGGGILRVSEVPSEVLERWIVFPSSSIPFFVQAAGADSLTLRAVRNTPVNLYDQLHEVKALRFFVQGEQLYTDDFSSVQPRIKGIVGFHAEFAGSLLTVTVLSRASKRHSASVQPHVFGWDEQNEGWRPVKTDLDLRYRYVAVTRSWRIRN